MHYIHKPHKISAWQWNGQSNLSEWPDWLPKPANVTEENALYQKPKGCIVFYKPVVSQGFNKEKDALLYVLTQTGRPVRVFKGEYLVKQGEELIVMSQTFLEAHYNLDLDTHNG